MRCHHSAVPSPVEGALLRGEHPECRVAFLDLPRRVRAAMADACDECGWTPLDDGPVFRYVRWIREDGE